MGGSLSSVSSDSGAPASGESDKYVVNVQTQAINDYEVMDSVVFLNVYDLEAGAIQNANHLFSFVLDEVTLGGAFHVGVEVYGVEWSYGHPAGIYSGAPRTEGEHVYRCSVLMGHTALNRSEMTRTVIPELKKDFRGCDYHMISKNCIAFCAALCRSLGVAELPPWVDRFPRIAQGGLALGGAVAELPGDVAAVMGRWVGGVAALLAEETEEQRRRQRVLRSNEAGTPVQRGPDWMYGDQDGGAGSTGVTLPSREPGWAEVKWRNGDSKSYRCGFKGHHDLIVARTVLSCEEGETCKVEMMPQAVTCAWYGQRGYPWDPERGATVTDKVRRLLEVSDSVLASNDNFGDPASGCLKRLCIEVENEDDYAELVFAKKPSGGRRTRSESVCVRRRLVSHANVHIGMRSSTASTSSIDQV